MPLARTTVFALRACVAERFWQRAPTKAEAYDYTRKTTRHHSSVPYTTHRRDVARASPVKKKALNSLDKIHESPFVKSIHVSKPNDA